MKQLANIILEDYRKEGFTRRDYIVYGILTSIALTAVCILAGAIE